MCLCGVCVYKIQSFWGWRMNNRVVKLFFFFQLRYHHSNTVEGATWCVPFYGVTSCRVVFTAIAMTLS